MKCEHYFYNCSKEYVSSLNENLYKDITGVIENLPKRDIQSEINLDLWWNLTNKGWSYDKLSNGTTEITTIELSNSNV